MKIAKKFLLVFIISIICFVTLGCNENNDKSENVSKTDNLPDYFGAELYNTSYSLYDKENSEITQYIILMSKIEIPDTVETSIDSTGGEFECNIEVIKGDYTLEEYTLYEIKLELKKIKFVDEKIEIKGINIFYDKEDLEKAISIKPQKCELTYLEGNYDNWDLVFTGTPLSIPGDMKNLPYELDADKNLIVDKIELSNDDFNVTNENMCRNVEIKQNQDTKIISVEFDVEESDLSKYTQYGTSAVFYYTVGDNEYVRMTPVIQLIYNPLYEYDNIIEKYYNEVLVKAK